MSKAQAFLWAEVGLLFQEQTRGPIGGGSTCGYAAIEARMDIATFRAHSIH